MVLSIQYSEERIYNTGVRSQEIVISSKETKHKTKEPEFRRINDRAS